MFIVTTKGTAILIDSVHVEKTYEEVLTGVVITLSANDARNLKAICGAIAARGDARATTDRIWQALGLAGVKGVLREKTHDGYSTGPLSSLVADGAESVVTES